MQSRGRRLITLTAAEGMLDLGRRERREEEERSRGESRGKQRFLGTDKDLRNAPLTFFTKSANGIKMQLYWMLSNCFFSVKCNEMDKPHTFYG